MPRRRNEVEFRMRDGRSVRVDTDWLFVLGMKTFPDVVDVTQMEASTSRVLEQIISGNRRLALRINTREAAEIAHVSTELKFANVLRMVENGLVRQRPASQQEAVDSLCVALRFGMKEAVGKLVDDVVFSFYDDNLFMCCKSAKALELIIDRKTSLMGNEGQEAPNDAADFFVPPEQPERLPIALPRQNASIQQMHKVFFNATKERLRTMLNRPVTAFRSGIQWVSSHRNLNLNLNRGNRPFRNFHEQFN